MRRQFISRAMGLCAILGCLPELAYPDRPTMIKGIGTLHDKPVAKTGAA